MNPTTASLENILAEAVEIASPIERRAFVAKACAGNSDLHNQVERMIGNHFRAGAFLERPAAVLKAEDISTPREAIGSVIGPYKLKEQIGEGGMGLVYVAEQHEPIRRKVALKLIKPGMDTRQVIARFEAERQALALMNHANIAKVFDGGETPSGRPYFVMELVKGVPITEYCDQNRLTPRARLELFGQVCAAVQHAHQKGIIHRDIKPSNVIVSSHDGTPVVKVIDFGVAKAIGQQLTDKSVYTHFSQFIGTPLYMSPEQAGQSDLDVDTRTDVYALGVLLYELLTGTTPFDKDRLSNASYDEIRRLIREEEPPKPSTRMSTLNAQAGSTVSAQRQSNPQQLSLLLRGELDWIVMKSLEKDRNRRYESATALAADVERYLKDEPVQACPPSRRYLVGKFLRKHRAVVLTAAGVLAVIIVLAGGFGYLVSERASRLATTEQLVREALGATRNAIQAGDLTLAQQSVGEAHGHLGSERDHLREAAAEIDRVRQEIKDRNADEARFRQFVKLANDAQDLLILHDAPSYDRTSPDALAQGALDQYGILETDEWITRLEKSHLTAGQKEQVRETAYVTLVSLADWCVRWQGRDANSGRLERCLELLKRAQTFHQPTRAFYFVRSEYHKFRNNPAEAADDTTRFQEAKAFTAWDYFLPGHTAGWNGDLKEAIRSYQAALRLQPNHYNSLIFLADRFSRHEIDRLPEAIQLYTGCLALRFDSTIARSSRAQCYFRLGEFVEAEADYSDNIAAAKSERARAGAYALRYGFYLKVGRANQAHEDLQRCVEAYEQALAKVEFGPEAPETLQAMHDLAHWYGVAGRWLKAVELSEHTVAKRKNTLGPDHPDTLRSMHDLAYGYADVGRLKEAIVMYELTLEKQRIKLRPDDSATLATMHNLAQCYRNEGRLKEAIAMHELTLGKRKAKLGLDDSETLKSMTNLAVTYRIAGMSKEAISMSEEALARSKAKLPTDHPDTLIRMNNLAQAYSAAHRFDDAITLHEQTLEKRKTTLGSDHRHTLYSMLNLASAYAQAERLQDAIALHERTLDKMKAQLGLNDPDTLRTMNNLAVAYVRGGRLQEGIELLKRTLDIRTAKVGPVNTDTLQSMFQLALAMQQAGKLDDADRLFRALLDHTRKNEGPIAINTASTLASLGLNLLKQERYADAEPILSECLEIRAKQQPDHWVHFNTISMLGGALLGQQKYLAAKPLLLEGYEGMKLREAKIHGEGKHRLTEAIERIVCLYNATEQPENARAWREKLAAGKGQKNQ